MTKPRLQALTHADLGGILALNATTGWTMNRDDWLTLLTATRMIGHKTSDGQVVSCAALAPFGPDKGSIGGVIVHPDFQRQGLAKEVLGRIVDLLPADQVSFCLISTPTGVGLYESLGFKVVDEIWRGFAPSFTIDAAEGLIPKGWMIKDSLPVKDLGNIIRLDEELYGAPRIKMIKRRLGQSPARAFLYDDENNLKGYALGSPQEGITVIGGVAAPNDDTALALVHSITERSDARYQVDIPCRHDSFIKRLEKAGFEWESNSPIMVKGDWAISDHWDQYFALSTQSFL